MTTLVEELFRQNIWANGRLIDVCEQLSEEQLDASAPGTYGTVREILQHIIGAQERYVARLEGNPPTAPMEQQVFAGFDDLRQRALRTGEAALQIASEVSGEPIKTTFRGKDYSLHPAVVLVQMINHSTEHREQVKAILSHLGLEAPNLDGWTYGAAAGLVTEAT